MKSKNQNSEKKVKFVSSNNIMQLEEFHASQAKKLINKLRTNSDQNVFIEIDCAPNGNLNPFHYGNGLKSMEIIKDLASPLLRNELPSLERKIDLAKKSEFKINFALGEQAGLWKRISPLDYEEKLDWNEAFCIKNEKGLTKIWHPEWRRLGFKNGFSTRGSLIAFIHSEPTYLQKFYLPLPTPECGLAWRMYYRLVFFIPASEQSLELIGGLWISRPGYKIYPEENALIGLVSPLTTTDLF
jgi:hypothetical protein